MKNRYAFTLALLLPIGLFAQTPKDVAMSELSQWDAVRGPWLAESLGAMANNEPIPDRNFPEDFTPAEMYAMVPSERRKRIEEADRNGRNAEVGTNPREENGSTRPNGRIIIPRPGCSQTMGRTYGDPHISSFDGKKFAFQTVGEFVMVKGANSGMEVQARQMAQSDEISLNTAAAMNVHGDRVGIYASDAPNNIQDAPLWVNGNPIRIVNETYYLPHGGTVKQSGKNYLVTWPTGEKVSIDLRNSGRMRFMNIAVNIFPCNDTYSGVLGNANGRQNDDFGDDNSSIAMSSVFDPFEDRTMNRSNTKLEKQHNAFIAKQFANQFRVTAESTLFDYAFGESTWTFTDESYPRVYLSIGDLTDNQRTQARRRCEEQGIDRAEMSGCIYDVAFAEIEPSPRPTIPSVTENTGRVLDPVVEPKPNVNRPELNPQKEQKETISTRPNGQQPLPIEKPNATENVNKEDGIGTTENVKENTTPAPKPEVNTEPVFKPAPKPVVKPAPSPVFKPTPKPKPVVKPAPKPTTPKTTPKVNTPSTPKTTGGTIGRGK